MRNNLIKYPDGAWGVRFRLPTCYRKHEFKRKVGALADAKQFRDEIRLKIARREAIDPALPESHQLAELCERWASEQGRCPHSARTARRYADWAGTLLVEDVTRDTLRQVLASLKSEYKPNTVIAYWNVLRSIFALAVDLEILPPEKSPFRWKYDLPKPTFKEKKITRGQLKTLFSKCDKRQEAMLKFYALTGLRRCELYSLRWEMVDLEKGYLLIEKTKNGKPHQLPLSKACVEILRSQQGNGSPFCFCTPTGRQWRGPNHHRKWRQAFDAAGLQEYTLHDLRHAMATAAVSTGSTIHLVSKLLNQTDLKTTRNYSGAHDEARREALEKVSVYFSCTDSN